MVAILSKGITVPGVQAFQDSDRTTQFVYYPTTVRCILGETEIFTAINQQANSEVGFFKFEPSRDITTSASPSTIWTWDVQLLT